ncbi:MAG TPA: PIN domain-containing protein [Lacipirellulaceae bacterium]|nr:PIN domain-containing protein [Lacipirellulaceae bacterium]
MIAVDTNIHIYAHDSRDARKQLTALQVIESLTSGVLLWQVACEFLAASRKLAPQGHRTEDSRAVLRDLLEVWTPAGHAWSNLDVAAELVIASSMSWWDALLVAACEQAGVTVLYSDDLGGRPSLRGVTFVNPFRTGDLEP